MPPTDTEGWARLKKVTPWAYPIQTDAVGLDKGKTTWMLAYAQGVWAYPTVPDDVVYTFAKALKDGYDVMKKMHPDLASWTWDWAASLDGIVSVPYHDGVVKLFKETGVWTPQHEAFQQKQLSAEKELMQKAKK